MKFANVFKIFGEMTNLEELIVSRNGLLLNI